MSRTSGVSASEIEDLAKLLEHSFMMSDKPGEKPETLSGDKKVSPDELKIKISKALDDREELVKYVEAFSNKERINRKILSSLQSTVSDYNKLFDLDGMLATDHDRWLICCGMDEKQLEEVEHDL